MSYCVTFCIQNMWNQKLEWEWWMFVSLHATHVALILRTVITIFHKMQRCQFSRTIHVLDSFAALFAILSARTHFTSMIINIIDRNGSIAVEKVFCVFVLPVYFRFIWYFPGSWRWALFTGIGKSSAYTKITQRSSMPFSQWAFGWISASEFSFSILCMWRL